ncbi:MAG: hypothetical protein IT290_04525 [Deltaproteobacteria bacterium]|nr:hypothetical protein [Deltaproteobacteria bacterium]
MPSPLRVLLLLVVPFSLVIYGGLLTYRGGLYLPTLTGYLFLDGVSARLFGASVASFGVYVYFASLEHFSGEHAPGGEPRMFLGISVIFLIVAVLTAWRIF